MKKIIFVLSLFVVLFPGTSCLKNYEACKNKSPQDEEAEIIAYASAQGMVTQKDASGMYYQVLNYGSGATPNNNSTVTVKYTGKLLNGTVFDQRNTGVDVTMANVIEGWKVGLALIHKGGTIQMIIPSSMGYGCNGFATVPANAILFFQVEVVDVH